MKEVEVKKLGIILLAAGFCATASFAAEKTIELHIEKKDGAIHWEPAKVEAKAGEKIKIVAKHDAEGSDVHGLLIPELKINELVYRGKPLTLEREVPKTLNPGEYKVGCQLHPKHVPATLVITK
jgi:plastocyanin